MLDRVLCNRGVVCDGSGDGGNGPTVATTVARSTSKRRRRGVLRMSQQVVAARGHGEASYANYRQGGR